jgi:two-component system phosphate regulon response regulator PhoB
VGSPHADTPRIVTTQPTDDLDPTPSQEGGRVVLVVDDDDVIRSLVRDGLEREGFEVRDAIDGARALREIAQAPPDLVVLDVNLPAVGGFDVLSSIRASSKVPVILLTGRIDELDRVLGLELGADDYVVKPFSPRELASRVRAVLRRVAPDPTRGFDFDFGDLRIDVKAREVRLHGEVVELTAREYDLLVFLAGSPRQVFSHGELLEHVWQSTSKWQDPATVTEHVRRVRAKIEQDRNHPRWIRTVRAAGYAFSP